MKQFLTGPITNTAGYIPDENFFLFLNGMSTEMANAIIKSQIHSSNYTAPIVLWGCDLTNPSGTTWNIATGAVWYQNNVYNVPSGSQTLGGGENLYLTISDADSTPESLLSDGTAAHILQTNQMTLTKASSLPAASVITTDLKILYKLLTFSNFELSQSTSTYTINSIKTNESIFASHAGKKMHGSVSVFIDFGASGSGQPTFDLTSVYPLSNMIGAYENTQNLFYPVYITDTSTGEILDTVLARVGKTQIQFIEDHTTATYINRTAILTFSFCAEMS